jgi:hypothetical protein
MLLGIDSAFARSGLNVDRYVRFMDMKRIPQSPEYDSLPANLFRQGYRATHFDAILACDNDALEFLRKWRDDLFPGVPVVFSSINDFTDSMLDGRTDITGTSENTDYAGTIDLALKLLPKTDTVVVVTDNTTTGLAHKSAVGKVAPQFAGRVQFRYVSMGNLTHNELAQSLAALTPRNVVLLLHHFRDKTGASYTVDRSTPLLNCAQSSRHRSPIALVMAVVGSEKNTGSTFSAISPGTSRKFLLFSNGIKAFFAPFSMAI